MDREIGKEKHMFNNIKENKEFIAVYRLNQYEVKFVDWDGSILKTQMVSLGGDASPPSEPTRPGYEFDAWDKPYKNIRQDTIITAIYLEIENSDDIVIKVGSRWSTMSELIGKELLVLKAPKVAFENRALQSSAESCFIYYEKSLKGVGTPSRDWDVSVGDESIVMFIPGNGQPDNEANYIGGLRNGKTTITFRHIPTGKQKVLNVTVKRPHICGYDCLAEATSETFALSEFSSVESKNIFSPPHGIEVPYTTSSRTCKKDSNTKVVQYLINDYLLVTSSNESVVKLIGSREVNGETVFDARISVKGLRTGQSTLNTRIEYYDETITLNSFRVNITS